jgi:signal transduction histidine kinase
MTLRWADLLRRAPSLGVQLLIGLVALAIVVAVTAGLVVRSAERDFLSSLLAAESEQKFQLLVFASTDDIISEDIPRLQTTMEELVRRDASLASLRIANEAGSILYQWRRLDLPAGAKLLTLSREVRLQGELFGTFAAAWNASDMEEVSDRHALSVAVAIGLICLMLSLLVYLFIRRIAVTPINRIADRLADFRRGVLDRDVRLPVFAPAELWRLEEATDTLGQLMSVQEQRNADSEAARAAAVAANRTKSEFLANMSNELRTPLNAILGFSEAMQMQMFGPLGAEKYDEYVAHINESGSHLLALISDILDISKIEFGKQTLDEDEVELGHAIRSCLALVRERARAGGVKIVDNLLSQIVRVLADERKLKQVLLNLLSNAVKFTPAGGAVTLSWTLDEVKGVVVEIADTGIGIPLHQIAKVLEPFGQAENSLSRRYEGSGLGLPLSKALIELHGGSFELESEVNVGTRVRFSLPPTRIMKSGGKAPHSTRRPTKRPEGGEQRPASTNGAAPAA